MIQTQDTQADRLHEAHDDLVAAVESLTSGDDWRAMLEVASRFHNYSTNNVLMILHQRPEASRVAGYRTWQQVGRQVRRGEHGIRIFAPIVRRTTVTDEETGEKVQLQSLATFRLVSVFDVEQTEGEPVPDVRPELLTGRAPAELWDGLAREVKAAGYDLARGDCRGANGTTCYTTKIVTVRNDVSTAQACKTLAHELAHVLLHSGTALECRGLVEVEAESVAFLVCRVAGLASDTYSFPYVARWADGDPKKVQATADRVLRAARAIVEGLGASLEEVA